MTAPAVATEAGLDLPFRWWDGPVVLALFVLAGLPAAIWELDGFVSQLIAAGVVAIYLAGRRRLQVRTVFGERPAPNGTLLGVGLGLLWAAVLAVAIALIRIATDWSDPVYPDWVVFQAYMEVSLWALAGSVVLAPLLEEVVFRSILYRGLLASLTLPLAAGLSALAFSAFHYLEDGGVVRAVASFLMSFLVVWLYHRTQSLWPVIALHATFNGAVILFGYVAAQIVGWGTTLT